MINQSIFKNIKKLILVLLIFSSSTIVWARDTGSIKGSISKNNKMDSTIIYEDSSDNNHLNGIYYIDNSLRTKQFSNTDIITSQDIYNEEAIKLKHSIKHSTKKNKTTDSNYNKKLELKLTKDKELKVNVPTKQNIIAINKTKYLIKRGLLDQAEENIDLAVQSNINTAWTLAEYAELYSSINKFQKGLLAYEKAIKLAPKRIELLYSYALSLNKSGQFNKAKAQLNKIIRINPNFMLAYYNLGSLYFRDSNYIGALKSFSTSVKLNPLNSDALYNTALTLEILNYGSLAEKYYLKCLELNPTDLHALSAIRRLNKA